ncbi:MAG: outer membrane protein assembly factor BamA [Acidobacteria bacterium]|nr:outer membrane protein assembly factor BamA [Acidobacteriota bacterium]
MSGGVTRTWRSRLFAAGVLIFLAGGSVAAEPNEPEKAKPEAFLAMGQPQDVEALPPADSGPVFVGIELALPTQGNVASVDPQTYLYYMEIDEYVSSPSEQRWTPYDASIEQRLLEDFDRLWETGFLTDLAIEVVDTPFANGVEGKTAIFLLEERERVRTVRFEGATAYDRGEIDEALESTGVEMRMDTRIGQGVIRRVEEVLRQMYAEKGYQFAEISHEMTPMAGGPKIVQLTFNIEAGPKVEVTDISFIGNDAMSAGALKRQMQNTKERWFLSFITGRGTYRPFGYEQDAEAIVAYYRASGYIDAQVGQPELEYLATPAEAESRPVRLRIPIFEGPRYRVGSLDFEGDEVMRREVLEELFNEVQPGNYYSDEVVRDAFEVARELYGSIGYYEMTAFPEEVRRSEAEPEVLPTEIDGDPVVDVTLHFQEGEQYFVNRINFVGNSTTHDEVIRREVNLVERGVFNTEALRSSVRRINQLGYFDPLDEENAIQVDKRPGFDNEVDLTLEVAEANMNQLTFGAGASQFDGFFLQLSFQTTNFLGRGESLTLSAQTGERIKNYNAGFTEPFLFGKPITGGFNVYRRDIRFINQFTQSSIGATTSIGFRTGNWSQMFLAYSYEETQVTELSAMFRDPRLLRFNPFLQDALLIGQGGARTISSVTPNFVMNTIDHPIFPTTGKSYRTGLEVAGIGGNTKFLKPTAEATMYFRQTRRLSFGFRARGEYIWPYGDTKTLPIFELLTMGGEFSLRGFDIRSVGPSDPATGLVIGGNKSLLFNAEYLISIADPVRIIFFYDTGQVADFGDSFSPEGFRTSTGAELRFFMPVLNVPFRLIYAWNPQREGVLNDRFGPQEGTVFKFAVGTTF